jgi:hypothetical protein
MDPGNNFNNNQINNGNKEVVILQRQQVEHEVIVSIHALGA